MFDFIEGLIEEISPSHLVLHSGGIGFHVLISLNSYAPFYESFQHGEPHSRIYIHQSIREDAHILYGFKTREEREIFRWLISVSGVGANTARMILSSLGPVEVQKAIAASDPGVFRSVKGIGTKTAERIIVDLRNKVNAESLKDHSGVVSQPALREEALSALVGLGFLKAPTEKVLNSILAEHSEYTLETLIRSALKQL